MSASLLEDIEVVDGSAVHIVTLQKEATRLLETQKAARPDAKMIVQVEPMLQGTLTAGRMQNGWNIRQPQAFEGAWYRRSHRLDRHTNVYTYEVDVEVAYTPLKVRADMVVAAELQNIVSSLNQKGVFPKWKVSALDGKPWTSKSSADIQAEASAENADVAAQVGYVPFVLPEGEAWTENFSHLYGLEDHIERVRRSVMAAIDSNWQHRFHCMLAGPPGCGKTDILQSLKKAVGEDAVLEFDGTSTTKAGAEAELMSREELPRLLIVEEIEKAPESTLPWLLGLMDTRAEIRKTTVRGQVLTQTRMLCLFTVNDYAAFERIAYGALNSRTSNKIFFNRPSRETRTRILLREIKKVNGDVAWIEPAIDYAEAIGSDDPRELIAICMCGRDALLDGSYQAMMARTSKPIVEKGA